MPTTRILHLFKRDYYLYRKPIFFILLGLFFLTGLLLFITTEEYCNGQNPIHITSLIRECSIVGAWLLLAAGAFHEFRQDGTRTAYLLMPATSAEKWIVRWFEVTILFLGLITLTSILSYITFSHLIHLKWQECEYVPWQYLLQFEYNVYYSSRFFIYSLLFLLGIVFNRYGVIKSILGTILIFSGLTFLAGIIYSLFNNGERTINLDEIGIWGYLPFGLAIITFYLSFLKLKQKQA